MSSEKRRRNRIQGGVNQRGRGAPLGSARIGGQRTPENYVPPKETSPQSTSFEGTLLGCRSPEGEEPLSPPKFVFEATNEVIRTAPKVITSIDPGETIISEGPSGISKIHFYPDFLDEEYSNLLFLMLYRELDWKENYVCFQGERHLMPRKMCWFGPLDYAFSGSTLEGHTEWNEIILSIHDHIKQKTGFEFNSVLANLYENEHNSVGWHSDDELLMSVSPMIASVSLGEVRSFELRKIPPPEEENDFTYMQHYKIPLPRGSLIIMDGVMQQDWQHRVPKEYHSREPRINLTFRTVSKKSPPKASEESAERSLKRQRRS